MDLAASKNDVRLDVHKFRSTLPIINAYENMDKEKRRLLEGLLSKKTKEIPQSLLDELTFNLENSGSLRYCAGKVDFFVGKAVASLRPIKDSVLKDYLLEMAESIRIK